jgi:Rha family phage regulatory protein
MSRDVYEAAFAELERAGCTIRHEYGRVHDKLIFSHPRCPDEHFFVLPKSASDWRAPKNAVTDVRRLLRQLEIVSDEEPSIDRPGVILSGDRPVCTSLDISKHFDRRHKDVLRAIDKTREECGAEFDRRNFTPITHLDNGREYRAYELSRDGFSLVVMGFTGSSATQWKIRYIDAFNTLESAAMRQPKQVDDGLLKRLTDDLDALTDIVLSLPSPAPQPQRKRVPWVIQRQAIRARREERRVR